MHGDLVQQMVLDEINDARVECSDDEANDLDNDLKHLQATMEKLAEDDQHYGQLKTEEGKLKEALELKVNKHQFHNCVTILFQSTCTQKCTTTGGIFVMVTSLQT